MRTSILSSTEEPLVSPREIAALFRVRERTVHDWALDHEDFPVVRLPKHLRMRVSEVAFWLERFQDPPRRTAKGAPPT